MNYQQYIEERRARGYTDADVIDNRSESTDELVKAVMADGYSFDSSIEDAIILRASLDLSYDEWESEGENLLFTALRALGYNEDGSRRIKYEIRTDRFEFRFGTYKDSIPAATADQIWDWYNQESVQDPEIRASFDTLEAAQEEFRKSWADYGTTRPQKGQTWWLLTGELAWIERNEYDEDGEFDQGGDVYDVSAQGYEKED